MLALMTRDYGGENLSRLSRDTKIGPGSTTRIKEQQTSVGIDVLERIAEAFSVEPWQLLAPQLGANLHFIEGARVVPVMARPPVFSIASSAKPEPGPIAGTDTDEIVRRARAAARSASHAKRHKN